MKHIHEQSTLARIFVGEADRYEDRPLFEAIVAKARDMGLAGATVLRLSEDLPLVIEVVDGEERLVPFLREVEGMLDAADCTGLITSEKVRIVRFESSG